jgi:hypothetical protein
MQRIYKIVYAGTGPSSADLVGLHLQETTDGFELIDPPRRILAQANFINSALEPLLTFHITNFKTSNWTLHVDSVSPLEMSGTWSNTRESESDSDSWTASGTGLGAPGDDEARAASAK